MDAQRPLAAVTPTLEGDILAVFAQANTTFTTGQLHRLLPRFSEDGIRKALGRLCEQGIVTSERAGNAYLYRFNRDHLAAGPILELAQLRETLLSRIEDRLGAWRWPPLYAAVFGSMARGSAGPASDVDLLLVRPDEVADDDWEAQVAELASDISKWTGNDARPIDFTVADVVARRKERVLAEVLSEGLTVHGERAWLHRQIEEGNARKAVQRACQCRPARQGQAAPRRRAVHRGLLIRRRRRRLRDHVRARRDRRRRCDLL